MKTQITRTEQAPVNPNSSELPFPPAPGTVRRSTQFILILDARGKAIAMARMEQLKNTKIPANRIRIWDGRGDFSEIWR